MDAELACGAVPRLGKRPPRRRVARKVMERQRTSSSSARAPRTVRPSSKASRWRRLHKTESIDDWEKAKPKPKPPPPGPDNHDTVTVLALDKKGQPRRPSVRLGLAHKAARPRRTRFAAIGSDVTLTNTGGAAGATAREEIIRLGGSHLVVRPSAQAKNPAGSVLNCGEKGELQCGAARRTPGAGGVSGAWTSRVASAPPPRPLEVRESTWPAPPARARWKAKELDGEAN